MGFPNRFFLVQRLLQHKHTLTTEFYSTIENYKIKTHYNKGFHFEVQFDVENNAARIYGVLNLPKDYDKEFSVLCGHFN